jgi:hypothetical protein
VDCGLRDVFANTIGFLCRCPVLEVVRLHLSRNAITSLGLVHLARLGACPALRNLWLDVSHNRLSGGSLEAFVGRFVSHPRPQRLETLHLNVGNAGLKDIDMATVGNVGSLPNLQFLHLGLRGNQVSAATVASILWLRFAKRLRHVTLDLQDCELSRNDMCELQALCTLSVLQLLLVGNQRLDNDDLFLLSKALYRPESRLQSFRLHVNEMAGTQLTYLARTEPRLHVYVSSA